MCNSLTILPSSRKPQGYTGFPKPTVAHRGDGFFKGATMKLIDFWNRVDRRGVDECWEWKGAKDRKGYGLVMIENKSRRVPRIAWEITNGPIPPGMQVCHKCDNPPCCNPNHLFVGTPKDNVHDCIAKGRDRYACGEPNAQSKLTEEMVREIRSRYKRYSRKDGSGKMAKEFSVDRNTVFRAAVGKMWRHILML